MADGGLGRLLSLLPDYFLPPSFRLSSSSSASSFSSFSSSSSSSGPLPPLIRSGLLDPAPASRGVGPGGGFSGDIEHECSSDHPHPPPPLLLSLHPTLRSRPGSGAFTSAEPSSPLKLLNSTIRSYTLDPDRLDCSRSLSLYDQLRNHLITLIKTIRTSPSSSSSQQPPLFSLIPDTIQSLSSLTRAGKDIVGFDGLTDLLIQTLSLVYDHFQSTHLNLLSLGPTKTPTATSASYYRFQPVAPPPPIIGLPTSLLIQITKFSSPQLSADQVKQIINLFVNQIGSSTCSEDHLGIVIDYVESIITFGYVPTRQRRSSTAILTDTSPSITNQLDGDRLLIDLVSFVAKVVGLQDLPNIVSQISALEHPNLPQHAQSSLVDRHSNSASRFRLSVERTSISASIVDRAKSCMRDLIRSPSNQAIKSLLTILTLQHPNIDQRSIIGAIRCLRYAFDDYDCVCTQKRSSSAGPGAIDDEQSGGLEASLTLLGLGVLLVKEPIKLLISDPQRTTDFIDYEILMLLSERLECWLMRSGKSTGMSNLMRDDDIECCLDLMIILADERLPVWLANHGAVGTDWCIDFEIQPLNLQPSKARPTKAYKTSPTPLAPFTHLFSMLFTQLASTEAPEQDSYPAVMSGNVVGLDKYFGLCMKLSKYLSSPLKINLIDQLEFNLYCSPEHPFWLSHLATLTHSFFGLNHPNAPIPKKLLTTRMGPSSKSDLVTEACQVRLMRLIADVFMSIRDLKLFCEELLQAIIIPALNHLLLMPYVPPFEDLDLIDQCMNLIRDILKNEIVNDLLSTQPPDQPVDQLPDRPTQHKNSPDTFDDVCRLLLAIATRGQTPDMNTGSILYKHHPPQSAMEALSQSEINTPPILASTSHVTHPSPLPLKAATTTATAISTTMFSPNRLSAMADSVKTSQQHQSLGWKRQHDLSYKAVVTLIKTFGDSLSISTGYSNSKCALIFSDLVTLLRPVNDPGNPGFSLHDLDHDLQRVQTQIVDSRTKLAILRWILRLRSDEDHRVQFVRDLEVEGLASILCRLVDDTEVYSPLVPTMTLSEQKINSPDKKPAQKPIAPVHISLAATGFQKSGDETMSVLAGGNRKVTPGSTSYNTPASSPYKVSWPTDGGGDEDKRMIWSIPEDLVEFDWPSKIETHSTCSLVTFDHVTRKDWDPSHEPMSLVVQAPTTPKATSVSEEHQSTHHMTVLPISDYMAMLVAILRYETDWELVSYVLCHLPGQLSNKHFGCGPKASQQVHQLRRFLCNGIKSDNLLHQVRFPSWQKVKLTDAHAVAYQTLSTLIAYKALFDKSHADEMVGAFVKGLSRYKDTAKACIHALTLSCLELRPSITKFLPEILRGLTKIVSSAFVSVHILELLSFLGQVPSVYANLTEEEYKMIFGIALQYISNHNQQHQLDESVGQHFRSGSHHARTPPNHRPTSEMLVNKEEEEVQLAFQQYVYYMAYYIIALWFVSLKLADRKRYVRFIIRKLAQACEGKSELDEPTEVCFDMLNRYTYSNAEPRPRRKETKFNQVINSSLGEPIKTTHWIIGQTMILTIKCLSRPGWAEVCIRRPSGMVKMVWELENLSGDFDDLSELDVLGMVIRHRDTLNGSESEDETDDVGGEEKSEEPGRLVRPAKQVSLDSVMAQSTEIIRMTGIKPNFTKLLVEPSFFALQLLSISEETCGPSKTRGKTSLRPIKVPDQLPLLTQSIGMIDLMPVVDFHKIGVVYVGPGQTTEREILSNQEGSKAYINFLSSLGQLIRLKGCDSTTGGLDYKKDENGKYTYVWGDDITQICFHVATLMPSETGEDGRDPILMKKALIGNDYVVIVFNESGEDYRFDCLKSAFNYLNIIIEPNTPVNTNLMKIGTNQKELKFYKISLQRKEGLPRSVGPMGENFKMVSSESLAKFVRQLGLIGNMFVQVYLGCVGIKAPGGGRKVEYVSNWRARLRMIKRIKDRAEGGDKNKDGRRDHSVNEVGKVDGKREGDNNDGQPTGEDDDDESEEENGEDSRCFDFEQVTENRDFTTWTE